MRCPDCGEEMMKFAMQLEDLSGWIVGWECRCPETHPDLELVIHADRDWTAAVLLGQDEDEDEDAG